jgi:hypothetical protein
MLSGRDYAIEGARLLPELYPDKSTWRQVSVRLYPRARALMKDKQHGNIGFFLFGMSERARGSRSYGK